MWSRPIVVTTLWIFHRPETVNAFEFGVGADCSEFCFQIQQRGAGRAAIVIGVIVMRFGGGGFSKETTDDSPRVLTAVVVTVRMCNNVIALLLFSLFVSAVRFVMLLPPSSLSCSTASTSTSTLTSNAFSSSNDIRLIIVGMVIVMTIV